MFHRNIQWFVILWFCFNSQTVNCLKSRNTSLTKHLVMQIIGGETAAQNIAEEYSMKLHRKIFPDDNYYHFEFTKPNFETNVDLRRLMNDNRVLWLKRQVKRLRETRKTQYGVHTSVIRLQEVMSYSSDALFNDPFYPHQWYLHNNGQTGGTPGNDLNVKPVWDAGFTGNGITFSVLDDGIQHTNPDIQSNYDPIISYDMVDFEDKDHDPTPDLEEPDNYHGTYCAAIMAAVANNSYCGIGIAYNAKVGGIRVLEGEVTDIQEALSLSYGLDKVDIYSASWGPKDDGGHIAGPGALAQQALERGIRLGRGGRGVIFVWAVGNGGLKKDNCNLDGYASSIYTIAISAITESGLSAYYSEPCASALVSAYVGGVHDPKELKNLFHDIRNIKIVVPKLNGNCYETFQGTSAAAPLAAGVIGLALEANPELTWRDVQHLLVHTSKIPNYKEQGWTFNSAGHHFHPKYGFGVIDAAHMVAKAQKWLLVKRQQHQMTNYTMLPRPIRCQHTLTLNLALLPDDVIISHLEHVIASLSLKHRGRRYLEVFLKSPANTTSQLLTRRSEDRNTRGIKKWDFMSVQFWDEDPQGSWTLIIRDYSPCTRGAVIGVLQEFSLKLYGTLHSSTASTTSVRTVVADRYRGHIPSPEMVKKTVQMEKRISKSIRINRKGKDFHEP